MCASRRTIEASQAHPNVVVIMMDDLGYGDLACYGAPDARTPNIDGLARDGVRLTDSYTSSPVCTPSRAAFMTGRYQQRCGLERDLGLGPAAHKKGLPASETSVATMLSRNGYGTALVGKWHLGYLPEFGPNADGFDAFYGVLAPVDYYEHKSRAGEPLFYENTKQIDPRGYMTDLLTDRAVSYIDANAHGGAFFLEVAYTAVHVPHQRPEDPTDIRTSANWYDSTRADYLAILQRADEGVGRILDALRRNGLDGNTLVVFCNDNGGDIKRDGRNAPLRGGKYQLFEGGVRSATILRWPGVLPAGAVNNQVSITMDLTATILAATGTTPARPLDGVDLVPILRGDAAPADRVLYWRHTKAKIGYTSAVRMGRWKYYERDADFALFDLLTDAAETQDVAAQHPDVIATLRDKLHLWEQDVDTKPQQ
jgi:arylsulfatase A-like enzyme